MSTRHVASLAASGFAPCLSSAVGGLIEYYNEIDPTAEIIAYQNGYHSLFTGNYVLVDEEARKHAAAPHRFNGPPIGSSRIKLTNKRNLVERGLVSEDEDPLQETAEQLRANGIDVLHTIGGDDANMTAVDLAAYLEGHDYRLTVVGLPKTIDNNIVSIRQSLGAWTVAEEVSKCSQNVIDGYRPNLCMSTIHEIMGRHYGWPTATGSKRYHDWLKTRKWVSSIGPSQERWNIHVIFLPGVKIDLDAEAARPKAIMDEQGDANIFPPEGAGVPEIIAETEVVGGEVQRNSFGHAKLDMINLGQWFVKQFAEKADAEKVMVQKPGYFSRSPRANVDNLRLVRLTTDLAIECTSKGESGVTGHNEEDGDRLKAIPFPHITGGKLFDISQLWFLEMMAEISQTIEPTGE